MDVGSKDTSCEELACESPCSGTLSSTRFSLNSCSHSGISEHNGAGLAANNGWPRSIMVSSIFGFWFLVGLAALPGLAANKRVSPFYHLFNIGSWHRHWSRIDSTLILPFSSLTVAWCCRSWWRRRGCGRWRMMTLLSWKYHWCWRMRTGRGTGWQAWSHDRNKVLRVALRPNPVFNKMCFWPLIHS